MKYNRLYQELHGDEQELHQEYLDKIEQTYLERLEYGMHQNRDVFELKDKE